MSAPSKRILVVNGPNLNLLGEREPEVYGAESLDDINLWLAATATSHEFEFFQSNHEGEIIDRLQAQRRSADALIINPGGLTHTSVALRDAIVGCQYLAIEVHLSDVHRRESFRQLSYVKDVCLAQITGQGKQGYLLAVERLERYWQAHSE